MPGHSLDPLDQPQHQHKQASTCVACSMPSRQQLDNNTAAAHQNQDTGPRHALAACTPANGLWLSLSSAKCLKSPRPSHKNSTGLPCCRAVCLRATTCSKHSRRGPQHAPGCDRLKARKGQGEQSWTMLPMHQHMHEGQASVPQHPCTHRRLQLACTSQITGACDSSRPTQRSALLATGNSHPRHKKACACTLSQKERVQSGKSSGHSHVQSKLPPGQPSQTHRQLSQMRLRHQQAMQISTRGTRRPAARKKHVGHQLVVSLGALLPRQHG